MNLGIQIAIGLIAAVAAIQLWRHGDRIRNSRYWFIGWLAYMLLIVVAGRALAPLLDGLPIDDDVVVPCMMFGTMLVVGILACVQLHRLRKLGKG